MNINTENVQDANPYIVIIGDLNQDISNLQEIQLKKLNNVN